ncbi:hypothetical protein [Legionella jordanis]|uniref:Uncharacterized protein n=1 Tax=Legionella jordanis TaxID=456 RepID=A0A0W0VCK6_9GAMM|nr:hypothetical protein [Legionella jordanis]KTD17847.1 hypothetical protein Ljor_2153 [Legionella jordanis]RMX02453.1 hypothetical protein EAW55_09400 [Legionella jordanis]RMX21704.1 hypothetical protein EAS68_02820 [Legionella jordanis]VEH11216.1 Uncharacterised protein [Legionella jordanis]HAT8713816.1 hypothetical protein [Legionella jordanis]
MKGILNLVAAGLLVVSAGAFASSSDNNTSNTNATSMDSNWICTTNASSSSVAADQQADQDMKNQAKSASDAFNFAAQHCRDCTKITCEVNK